MTFTDFDKIFDHIGGFGRYQWSLFSLLCFYNCILAFNYFSQIFLVLTPPHWCSPPPLLREDIWRIFGVNVSDDELLRLTVPLSSDGRNFEKCSRFDINMSQVSSINYLLNATHWPKATCTHGWSYNFTEYYPSLTSELDWVCDEDWKGPLAQAIFFAGSVVGGPLFGWLADFFGRVPVIAAVNCIGGTFSILTIFCSSFLTFSIARFIVGLTHESDFMIFYILALEYVSPKHRTFMSNVPIMLFSGGSMCAIPWIAKAIGNWKIFAIAMALPSFIGIALPWLVVESSRWLLSKGKEKKALAAIRRVAKVNRRELDKESIDKFRFCSAEEHEQDGTKDVSWIDLLKSPILRKRFICLSIMWIALYLAYDGYVRLSENTGFDFFLTFTIMGAIELPADLLTMLLMEWLGRKHTTLWSLILSGIAAMSIVFVQKDSIAIILLLSIAGRFLVTMAMNVGQQYIIEVLPTAGRAQGAGAIHTFGVAAAFTCPYIVYTAKYSHWVPYFSFGAISLAGGLASMFLPETLGEKLPDTLLDGEIAFSNQPLCYNPFEKNKTKYNLKRTGLESIKQENIEMDMCKY